MSDTIEGLRWRAREAAAKGDLISAKICDNAAGEIKRLREALLKIAGSMIGTGQNSRVLVEIAREALGDD